MQRKGNATVRPQMVGYQQGAPKRNPGYRKPEPHYTAQDMRRQLKVGVLIGATVVLLVFAAVMWLWAVPTVDGAVEMAKQAVEAVS